MCAWAWVPAGICVCVCVYGPVDGVNTDDNVWLLGQNSDGYIAIFITVVNKI